MHGAEICALGATTMPTSTLVRLLFRRPVDDEEVAAAVAALSLFGPAREAALRRLRVGPQLLAAVELGRRAWMLPSPAGRRLRNPVDVAAIVAPRAIDDPPGARWILSLDLRLTLARLERAPTPDAGYALRSALGAAASRIVVASRRPSAAVPDSDDVEAMASLGAAAALVGVSVLDHVILGEDGFASMLRLGLLPPGPRDPRYR
jgi:hypothetical protein